jgi:hypothetical protein
MFDCLDAVPEATELEIQDCLISSGWDSKHAVDCLKVMMLGKCPEEKWTFGHQKNPQVCRMILATSGWDLEVAKARVRKEKTAVQRKEASVTPAPGEENLTGSPNHAKQPITRKFGTILQLENNSELQPVGAATDKLELADSTTTGSANKALPTSRKYVTRLRKFCNCHPVGQ